MQNEIERSDIENIEHVRIDDGEATVEDLGLEIIEDTPQLAMTRPVRHIRQ